MIFFLGLVCLAISSVQGVPKKRTSEPIITLEPRCPDVQCGAPWPCKVDLRLDHDENGCPLCWYCPAGMELKKRTSEPIFTLERGCPDVQCGAPWPCKVDLRLGHDENGCPLCWYCPAGMELKKRTSEPIFPLPRPCPEVMCEHPGPCDVDLIQDHDTDGCPLCWYCPAKK